MIKKILAVAIVIGLALSFFKRLFLIAVIVLLSLWLIRILADLFWWGRDRGNW